MDIKHDNVDHVIETHAGDSKSDKFRIIADAYFVGDSTVSKPTNGILVMINSTATCLARTRQKEVSKLTSKDAEYISIRDAAKRPPWAQILYARIDGREVLWDDQGI
ncbi:hypothetical protein GcM1_072003 [Golovinomyces cichoracearum]|uniref:Uncharacterized protein n=1 Tax=Golovinomyces cichoracearum TaxID=62708 RepID=A0A420JCC1_9PEZI|nr:hypothetical protein GcM1_072003 [Golovinomyces cichoracearum]